MPTIQEGSGNNERHTGQAEVPETTRARTPGRHPYRIRIPSSIERRRRAYVETRRRDHRGGGPAARVVERPGGGIRGSRSPAAERTAAQDAGIPPGRKRYETERFVVCF